MIVGKNLRQIPPEMHQQIELPSQILDLVKKCKLRDKQAHLFWNRWTKQYFSELRQYHSTNQFTKNLNPSDYCLLLIEKAGKYNRPTAVVTDVLKDGTDQLK